MYQVVQCGYVHILQRYMENDNATFQNLYVTLPYTKWNRTTKGGCVHTKNKCGGPVLRFWRGMIQNLFASRELRQIYTAMEWIKFSKTLKPCGASLYNIFLQSHFGK